MLTSQLIPFSTQFSYLAIKSAEDPRMFGGQGPRLFGLSLDGELVSAPLPDGQQLLTEGSLELEDGLEDFIPDPEIDFIQIIATPPFFSGLTMEGNIWSFNFASKNENPQLAPDPANRKWEQNLPPNPSSEVFFEQIQATHIPHQTAQSDSIHFYSLDTDGHVWYSIVLEPSGKMYNTLEAGKVVAQVAPDPNVPRFVHIATPSHNHSYSQESSSYIFSLDEGGNIWVSDIFPPYKWRSNWIKKPDASLRQLAVLVGDNNESRLLGLDYDGNIWSIALPKPGNSPVGDWEMIWSNANPENLLGQIVAHSDKNPQLYGLDSYGQVWRFTL